MTWTAIECSEIAVKTGQECNTDAVTQIGIGQN
jgi:hypothetical protein